MKYQKLYQKMLDTIPFFPDVYTVEDVTNVLNAVQNMADLEERGVLITIGEKK